MCLRKVLHPHHSSFFFWSHLYPIVVGFSSVEVGYLLLGCSSEDIEEVTDHLDLLWILRVSLEVGLLELVMGETVEVIDIPFWTF